MIVVSPVTPIWTDTDDNCEVDIESLLTIRVAEGLRAPNPITVKGNDRRGKSQVLSHFALVRHVSSERTSPSS